MQSLIYNINDELFAIFKNIDDTLWKDAGCNSVIDYIEQTNWILSLKYPAYCKDKKNHHLNNDQFYRHDINF